MKKEMVDKILNETEIGYDSMAVKFSETRKYFWRGLEFIGDYVKDGDTVFDFGCGNGRLLELFSDKKIEYCGADVSEKLIEIAKNKYSGENIHPVKYCGAVLPVARFNRVNFSKLNPSQTSLSFNDDFFNAVYSIAVFHHFPGKEYQERQARELYRITKPGGYAIITVWNLWPASLRQAVVSASRGGQKKYLKNIIKNWMDKILDKSLSPHQFQNRLLNTLSLGELRLFLRTLVFGKNWRGDKLDWNDCYINFKDNQGNVFKRYHHAFTKRELKKLFQKAGFKMEKIINNRNIIFIGKKD